ncbi:MAG: TldD/PmbA family protein [Thermoplasmata archaeon]|nr:TldD/PmbA family protein [Thermoplasmata archaeon]
MYEDILEYAIDKANVDYAEIRIQKVEENSILFVNGSLKGVESIKKEGFHIRVLNDGMLGFSFSNSLRKESIIEALEKAEKMARARIHHAIGLSDEKMERARYYVRGRRAELDEKIEWLKDIDSMAKEHSRNIFYSDTMDERYYANSHGAMIISKIPRIAMNYLITVEDERIEQMGREFGNAGGWEKIPSWKVEENMSHDIEFMKKMMKKAEKFRGKGDIILGPYVTGLIAHESCGHPWEADRIIGREAAQAGKSFVNESMLGEKFASEVINVVDDPTIKGSYGFYLYDDEGVKAEKRYLIKNGIINEFLHNRETAFLMNTKSNAAARAVYGREPIVRMANTYFEPGDYRFDEMVEEIKNGIYMKTYMEWNIDDTRYNQKYVGQEAYIIRNGEISGIAFHPAIEITTPAFYKKVDAAGRTLEFYPAVCGKGDPMQGIPVTTGGVDLRLRDVMIK